MLPMCQYKFGYMGWNHMITFIFLVLKNGENSLKSLHVVDKT